MTKRVCVIVALALLVGGCGIFETRQAQPPQQGRSDFQPPTAPSIVITNLQNAVADKNADNYLSCLSDTSFGGRDFTFVPPVDVYNTYQGIFSVWNKNSEGSCFRNLVSQSTNSGSPVLTLTSESLVPQGPDSAVYNADYILIWPNSSSSKVQQVQGNLQFYLGIDRNQDWSIYRWIDSRVVDTLKTWSEMKAQFSQ
jgi:hypothetical protein